MKHAVLRETPEAPLKETLSGKNLLTFPAVSRFQGKYPGSGYTYRNYVRWETEPGERWEIIDGTAYAMAAPTGLHQHLLGMMYTQFAAFLEDYPCEVFLAPRDVRLFPQDDEEDTTVVQPDILVVCDREKLTDDRVVKGAPDLVVEILSPGSKKLDMFLKKELYFRAEVKEYWVVHSPQEVTVFLYTPEGYAETTYSQSNGVVTVPVSIFHHALKVNVKTPKTLASSAGTSA